MSIEPVIAAGRRLVATTMLDTCTIRRRTLGTDTSGGSPETWSDLLTGVQCRFGTITASDPFVVVDAIYGAPTALALVPLGTDVETGDRLVNESTGRVWLVVGQRTPDSETAVAGRLYVREV